ncbi:hypothetical protein [Chryseobacterium sp.]|uniref:hypothetical protein n=1 Tax=Chryseobacterium sp. TaxID=1871047 RepID=UPI0011CC1D8B|nr:hypothetical protein [Chryseobacterium sp.]TXF79216.1 hypothetical protein FUA25_02140 [Chryseobacterium sp.]
MQWQVDFSRKTQRENLYLYNSAVSCGCAQCLPTTDYQKSLKTNTTMTIETKPQKTKTGISILIITLILGFLNVMLTEFLTDIKSLSSAQGVFTTFFTFLIIGFLIYEMNKGKNWARITFLILTVLGLFFLPFTLPMLFEQSLVIGSLSSINGILQIAALILIFSGESNKWFKQEDNRYYKAE